MPIEIDDPKTVAIIEKLMRATGEADFEVAVEKAVEERLERVRFAAREPGLAFKRTITSPAEGIIHSTMPTPLLYTCCDLAKTDIRSA